MKRTLTLAAVLLAATMFARPALAATPAEEAAALPEKTGVRGGLGLLLGAKDPAAARALAAASALYVQALQPDAKQAAAWGAALSSSECKERENLGVRNAAFDPAHYNTNLFNLIVVEDAAALGNAKLADIERILVPGGCAAFRTALPGFAEQAKALAMTDVPGSAYAAVYRKAVKEIEWKLPLETKWEAGPRSQIANGFNGICAAAGKLFYLEQKERDNGNLADSASLAVARDAYNGRTLWTVELPGGYSGREGNAMVATSTGRLFVKTGANTMLCLDGETGKTLFEIPAKMNRETRVWLVNDDLLSIMGDVRSTTDGQPVWKYPVVRYHPLPGTIVNDVICFCDGTNIFAKKLATGEDLWKVPASEALSGANAGSLAKACGKLLARTVTGEAKDELNLAALDPANGKLLWSYTWKVRTGGDKYFNAGGVNITSDGDKVLLFYRHNQEGSYADEIVALKLDAATGKEAAPEKTMKEAGDFHGCFSERYLGDYITYYDLWVNKQTLETSRPKAPHPACFFGTAVGRGIFFDFPSRKSGPITGVGPVDTSAPPAEGGPALVSFGRASSSADTTDKDFAGFRGGPAGGNFNSAAPGAKLAKAWETQVGVGGGYFGTLSSERTGLSQAAVGYGLAVVADIDGQRIVALDAASGAAKWTFAVGSRVDFPPTLYKGLCLAGARDGFVYALDAANGKLVYRLRVAPKERYIGSREKLESLWPVASDVVVAGGVAYVAVEGAGAGGAAFKPETGEAVDSVPAKDAGLIALGLKQVPGGRELQVAYDMVLKGNSIPRTNEDNVHGFCRGKFDRKLDARVMAFDDKLTVSFQFLPKGEGWANKGTLLLKGIADNPAKPVWTSEPIELLADDIVLTPQFAYCAGHYQRVKKDPELWVVSREDGKVVNTLPAGGFPAFLGMSAADKRVFVSTRDGKLVCFQAVQ